MATRLAPRRTPKVNFTKRTIESLAVPARELSVFDEHTPGLGLLLYPSGTRSFFHLRYVRGYPRRTTIGKFPDYTVDQARGKASALNAMLAAWKLNNFAGDDPFEARRDPTLDALTDAYIEKRIRAHASRPDRAVQAVEWQIKKYLSSWRNRRIDSIRKSDVLELHDRLGRECGHHTANRTVQLLRRLFYWAEEAGMWQGVNPAAGVKFFHEAKRTRFLQPDELPRFFTTLAKEKNRDLRDFVLLAMWTGARKSDIFAMRWENIALDDNQWQVPEPKGRTPYLVPLTPEAIEILRARRLRARRKRAGAGASPYVFASRGRTGHIVDLKSAWAKLLKRAKVTGLRQHDLRRTLGSYQAIGGTSLKIIGESLGHKSLQATAVYAQVNLDPVRASVLAATRTIIAASKAKLPAQRKPKQLQEHHEP